MMVLYYSAWVTGRAAMLSPHSCNATAHTAVKGPQKYPHESAKDFIWKRMSLNTSCK